MVSKSKLFALGSWAALSALTLGCGATNIVKESAAQMGDEDDAGMHTGGGGFGDGGMSKAADPACDMTGLWALRMTTWAHGLADTLGANWYYLEIAQVGEELEVVDHVDCGVFVDAGFSVHGSEKLEAVLYEHNRQTGRKGTMKRSGEQCDVWFNRFWSVRGADEDTYLPKGHHDPRDIADLQAEAPLPSKANLAGAEDWDEDMQPGITMLIGNDGARYSVQRDWLEWFSCNGNGVNETVCTGTDPAQFGLPANENFETFTIRADFNNEDSVLGASNPIYEASGTPIRTGEKGATNRVQFLLLGRRRDVGAAKDFWALPDTKARCARIRELLPAEKKPK
jgi:hypothetical protein